MEKINLENMTEVCDGEMTLKDVTREIRHYIMRSPKRLIIDIARTEDPKGYSTTIYIPIEDFKGEQ